MKHSSIQFTLFTCQQRNKKNKQTDKDLFSAQIQEKKCGNEAAIIDFKW